MLHVHEPTQAADQYTDQDAHVNEPRQVRGPMSLAHQRPRKCPVWRRKPISVHIEPPVAIKSTIKSVTHRQPADEDRAEGGTSIHRWPPQKCQRNRGSRPSFLQESTGPSLKNLLTRTLTFGESSLRTLIWYICRAPSHWRDSTRRALARQRTSDTRSTRLASSTCHSHCSVGEGCKLCCTVPARRNCKTCSAKNKGNGTTMTANNLAPSASLHGLKSQSGY